MSIELTRLSEKLVSVSELSQGQASRIVNDVAQNHHDYIVIKNSKPAAVLMPIEDYNYDQRYKERMQTYFKLLSIHGTDCLTDSNNVLHVMQDSEDDGSFILWPREIPSIVGHGATLSEALEDLSNFLKVYSELYLEDITNYTRNNAQASELPLILKIFFLNQLGQLKDMYVCQSGRI